MSTQIPARARVAVRERHQGRCERCGGPGAHWHHRKSRSVRGEHRHCICNGLWLCASCHTWAHANHDAAVEEGVIVPRWGEDPGDWSVLTYQGIRLRLGCDGTVSTVESEEE